MFTQFSDNFTIALFHYDGKTSEWDQFEWSKHAIHVSVPKQTKWSVLFYSLGRSVVRIIRCTNTFSSYVIGGMQNGSCILIQWHHMSTSLSGMKTWVQIILMLKSKHFFLYYLVCCNLLAHKKVYSIGSTLFCSFHLNRV